MQIEGDFEIVLINDGSSDNLLDILNHETDSRLRIITQDNGGESNARNRGIREAKGKYIAFLDSDDAWLPNHLQTARAFFEKFSNCNWFATKAKKVANISEEDLYFDSSTEVDYCLVDWFLELTSEPLSSSMVIKRSLVDNVLCFPEGVKMFADNVAWCRLALQAGNIGTCSITTALYRQWSGSATEKYWSERRWNINAVGLDAIILHQEIMKNPLCPLSAKLYFKKRAMMEWMDRISKFKVIRWKKEILDRLPTSGLFITCILYLFYCILYVSSRVMYKLISRRYASLQKKYDKLLLQGYPEST